MGRIHVLDKTISNRIAAGEVVERPASVIKELLENAIDAGAKHITTEIKSGGITYIRVADDGCGMSREDAELCLLRHATSKISRAEDLDAIATLGFRGEAMASIAAVSKMDLYTRAAGEETGTHLSCVCGETAEAEEAGCPSGTTVLVRDLFCSTPARMKFLKKDYTEAGYVADVLNRLALSHPDISFKLIQNGKEALFTSGSGDLAECVCAVYGREIGKETVPLRYEEAPVRIGGLAGRGTASRPNRNMENFFVNGRYIRSPLLSRAAEDAYKNELMTGRFPVCVVNIELDPALVDINVHPTKLEAKFADEKQMYHCVYWAVKNALHQNVQIPEVAKGPGEKPFERSGFSARVAEELRLDGVRSEKSTQNCAKAPRGSAEQESEERPAPEKLRQASPQTAAPRRNASFRMREAGPAWPIPELIPPAVPEPAAAKQEPPATLHSAPDEGAEAPRRWETEKETASEQLAQETEYKICGQVFDTYIIVEKGEEMLMVDQHAAHERLRYEELLRQYRARRIASQSMLLPVVITLSAQEMAVYREHSEEIAALGFEIEEFGANTVAVRATPEELTDRELADLLPEILTLFSENRRHVDGEWMSRILYSIACKGAVKANHSLHGEEIRALLDAVFALEGINTCPHGRPITVAFPKTFLEKQFKRIV